MGSVLKLYPSGFLGSSEVEQTPATDPLETARRVFTADKRARGEDLTSSLEVQRLWRITLSNDKHSRSFEHKEDILRIALKVFGVSTLKTWLDAQKASGEYGDLHARWVDETLELIYERRSRTMAYHSWSRLLTTGGNAKPKEGVSAVIKRVVDNAQGLNGQRVGDIEIRQLILDWVRQPGGIEDLMASLYVLFGSR